MHLPMELVWHVMSYMKWKYSAVLVGREWLKRAMKKRVRPRTWHRQVRIYSYLAVFGQKFVGMSWHHYCTHLSIRRRARNRHGRLTWRAAATTYIRQNRCRACGTYTVSNVIGVHICTRCRFNIKLKFAYMIQTGHARRMGVPEPILKAVPYHLYRKSRLRFWHDIEQMLSTV